jgi:hypothetical protein
VSLAILFFAVFFSSGCIGAGSHSSDERLEVKFRTHHSEFEELLSMVQSDDWVISITPTAIIPTGGRRPVKRDDVAQIESLGVSRERWLRYQKLLAQLSISRIGRGMPGSHARYTGFTAEPASLWNGATSKGYIWSEDQLSPVVVDLDRYKPPEGDVHRKPYVAYKRLTANWYLFFQRE